ncbi:MAG: AMP-binding protein [Steroidobacteraceae bacterium]
MGHLVEPSCEPNEMTGWPGVHQHRSVQQFQSAVSYNPSMSEPDPRRPLERLFEEQSRSTPDRVALIEGARSITYAQLDTRSARAAVALRNRGIAAGSVVGLHLDRSADWVASVLAILRTQAAVLPLPPNYPSARLGGILTQAGVQAVIHNRATPLDPALGQRTLDFDELCREPAGATAVGDEDDHGDVTRAAFVLCSSGSTGLPKMIVRSHRSFFHRLAWTWTTHPFMPGEVGCHKAHTTTTHGLYELFEPLLRGVPVLIVPDAQVRDLEQFWWIVKSQSVTRLLIVPSAMKASLDMPGFTPPPLRVVVLMGEHLQSGLAQRIVAAFPAATRLYSIYGSTEASSTLMCDLRDARPGEELPLGRPITGDVGVHVLQRNLEPVETGHSGRLYMSGPALFDGYFRNPELTSSVLIRHPDGTGLLYDTRDDVRRAPDGNLLFVGRVDDTVKIRGFRVELGEVERAICAHPAITQAAVVATGSDATEAMLIGFFTPRDVPPGEVYSALRDRLPPYMIPSALVGLDAFPLTERSKLDRRRLLAEHLPKRPDGLDDGAMSGFETRVAAQWERTLGHRRFDLHSSFFEVGGTSLTTSVLVHRLRVEFSLDRERLPGQFAYRFPTVASMAQHLEGGGEADPAIADGGSPVLVTLRRATDASKAPLYFVAPSGGTIGAYQKVAAALRYEGEIVGVRDPFVDGDRDPTEGFKRWVGHYLDAIRNHQPRGPYYLAAYSSAGAFGYDMARQLRQQGAEVGLLALIDPLDIGGDSRRNFGWWACRAAHSHAWLRRLVRLAGWLRRPSARLLRALSTRRADRSTYPSTDEYHQLRAEAIQARGRLMAIAALMELNTGLPLDLSDAEIPAQPPGSVLQALQDRAARVMPGVDAETIERIAIQYPLQARSQQAYVLRPCDAPVLLVEPVTPYAGLLESQLRPYLGRLRAVRLELGAADARVSAISTRFGSLAPHYLSMRDDRFAASLAQELDLALEAASRYAPTSHPPSNAFAI